MDDMKKLPTFRAVIELWPSIAELAEDLGEKPDTVRKWKERNSIPGENWKDLVSSATKRGYELSLDRLAAIASKPEHKRRNAVRPAAVTLP